MNTQMRTPEVAKAIISFMHVSEKLKFEKRHSWLSNGDQESVAEHCWQMALLAILINDYLDAPVDIAKVLKLILIHDIIEAKTGDIPCFEESVRNKFKKEAENQAILEIKTNLSGLAISEELFHLWHEFENGQTQEAKFAKALDNIEVQIQHNLADISTWEAVEYNLALTKMDPHCEYDSFLKIFCDLVKNDAKLKMLQSR